ncbi:hypothetical protein Trydic_g4444 [Trypoxylus dichotomus]
MEAGFLMKLQFRCSGEKTRYPGGTNSTAAEKSPSFEEDIVLSHSFVLPWTSKEGIIMPTRAIPIIQPIRVQWTTAPTKRILIIHRTQAAARDLKILIAARINLHESLHKYGIFT